MNDVIDSSEMPYSRFFDLCSKAAQRYGSLLSLPISSQPYDYLKCMYESRYVNGRILDYGCGVSKTLQKVLKVGDSHYHSCDSDPSGSFTYSSINAISHQAVFEIVAANQVFEHLSFERGIQIAMALGHHVAPGGIFQIGVPNPAHPTRYLSNPVHKTPWNHLNLCALLDLCGLETVRCARCNKVPGPRWYERPFINLMCRVFRMDWCDTVYVVGRSEGKDG